jgi:hypothetical protein
VTNKRIQVLKIQRSMNATAHTLASQAFRHSGTHCTLANVNCSNAFHESSCPLSMALQCVCKKPFSIITASCC